MSYEVTFTARANYLLIPTLNLGVKPGKLPKFANEAF